MFLERRAQPSIIPTDGCRQCGDRGWLRSSAGAETSLVRLFSSPFHESNALISCALVHTPWWTGALEHGRRCFSFFTFPVHMRGVLSGQNTWG